MGLKFLIPDFNKLLKFLIVFLIGSIFINIGFGWFLIAEAKDLTASACRLVTEVVFAEGCLPRSQTLEYITYNTDGYKKVSREINAWETMYASINSTLQDGPNVLKSWVSFDPDTAISVRACKDVPTVVASGEEEHYYYEPVGGQLDKLSGEFEDAGGTSDQVSRGDIVEVKVTLDIKIPMIFYFNWQGDPNDLPVSIEGQESYTMYIHTSKFRSNAY